MLKDKNLMWFITDQCNLNCLNCSSHCEKINNKYYISLDDVTNILLQLSNKKINFNNIDLSGGEALLHPHIINICLLIRKYLKDIRIQIYTNGLSFNIFSDKEMEIFSKENISFQISIYPRKQFLSIYETNFKRLKKFKIDYNISRTHFLFHSTFISNKSESFPSLLNCQNISFNNNTYYLKNNIFYPCCVAIEYDEQQKTENFGYVNIKNIKTIEDINNIQNNSLPICKKCSQFSNFLYPWHCTSELKSKINNNHFNLYKKDYLTYYQLYHEKDQSLSNILYHPLLKANTQDDCGLLEKQYINNKYINGFLDILIYYDNLIDITKIIKLLKSQTIIKKCNLYFIKNINYKFSKEDEILYYNFLPFSSPDYNSYFLQASSIKEAKNLFLQHSFLNYKIQINLNDFDKLKNSFYLENIFKEYHYDKI